MPTPTPDEIIDAAAQNAADGIASGEVDGRKVVALDPLKQLEIADEIAKRPTGTNAQGGRKSPWRGAFSRAIKPGASA